MTVSKPIPSGGVEGNFADQPTTHGPASSVRRVKTPTVAETIAFVAATSTWATSIGPDNPRVVTPVKYK